MRKHYRKQGIFRIIASCVISVVMLSATGSVFFTTNDTQKTEWKKLVSMPEMAADVYTVPVQRAVVYELVLSLESEGMVPEAITRCRSPSPVSITITSV